LEFDKARNGGKLLFRALCVLCLFGHWSLFIGASFMKGPHQRLKFDLRRLWECPACKRRERTAGTVTFRHCECQMRQMDGKLVVMKLIEDGVQRKTPPIVIHHEPPEAVAVSPTTSEVAPVDAPIETPEVEPPDQG
jgi:hypothetical protein